MAATNNIDWVEPVFVDEADPLAGLVLMTRNGEELYIHPDTVSGHEAIGWRVKADV